MKNIKTNPNNMKVVRRRFVRFMLLILMPAVGLILVSHVFGTLTELTTIRMVNMDTYLSVVTSSFTKSLTRNLTLHCSVTHDIKEEPKIEYPPFIELEMKKAYLYSAFFTRRFLNESQTNITSLRTFSSEETGIVISGWERQGMVKANVSCCILLKDKISIQRVVYAQKSRFAMNAKLTATQFRCPTNESKSDIAGISLTYDKACSKNVSHYITINEPDRGNATHSTDIQNDDANKTQVENIRIAVCTKLAYGSLNARRLVEWLEAHRLFGVDKVVAYSYKLNMDARKVFDYYETLGFSKLYEFDIPDKDHVVRDVGEKNRQSWNDEQIALYDCQERLQGYTYVAVIDTDEFMVPANPNFNNTWKKFLNEHFKHPKTSTIYFQTKLHLTSWPKNDHPLFIGQYINSTHPMMDRIKFIYVPSRVKPGGVFTHHNKKLDGLKSKYINPKHAVLHHYRSCRKEWLQTINVEQTHANSTNTTQPAKKELLKANTMEEKSTNSTNSTQPAKKEELKTKIFEENSTNNTNSTKPLKKKKAKISCASLEKYPSEQMENVANIIKSQVLSVIHKIGI